MSDIKYDLISNNVSEWYKINKRELPWRNTRDPYLIWVCEIMSQQTQIFRVVDYYNRFIKALPTVNALSDATDETLLLLWQGLGYYSRVQNMKKAATIIAEAGFPSSGESLQKLPGIGPYTAAAIASISFGEKIAAVDGNVIRLITRLFSIPEDVRKSTTVNEIRKHATSIVSYGVPGDINQGMIELGALICTPKNPKCLECPLIQNCSANKEGTIINFPYKTKGKSKKDVYYKVLILEDLGGKYLVNKREDALLNGIYAFPQFENLDEDTFVKEVAKIYGVQNPMFLKQISHVFSHQIWHLEAYYAQSTNEFTDIQSINHELNSKPLLTSHIKLLK